ncbi:MAG: MauE/DoxX family redox-associated membrane protein [Desulfobacterales bacterium]|jgi:hypothetical protein
MAEPSTQEDRKVKRSWIYRGIRWGLALVFFYAGVIKLADPEAFAVIIGAYGLVPEVLLMPVAIILPAIEVLAAIGLWVDLRGSLATVAVLLTVFIAILGYGLWMGLDVDCGCYGPGDPEGRAYAGILAALYRDVVLAGGVLLLYIWRSCFRISPVTINQMVRFCRPKKGKRNGVFLKANDDSGMRDRDGRRWLWDGGCKR